VTPGEQFVFDLEDLRKILNSSSTERTVGLAEALGRDCPYYTKSIAKFIANDYLDLAGRIQSLHSLIKKIEDPQ
jgi:hypothetical protein